MKSRLEHRILVVEDSEDDAELILGAFVRSRFRDKLLLARDGEEALASLIGPKAGLPPVMVLLDLGLPRTTGLEVLRRMRADERLKYVPVVAFTSDTGERDRGRALDGGANLFVVKPRDAQSFVKFVRWIEGLLEFVE